MIALLLHAGRVIRQAVDGLLWLALMTLLYPTGETETPAEVWHAMFGPGWARDA